MAAHYLLHPRAPLVFGTGAPSGFGVGGETLGFPWPATTAGALRAAFAAAAGGAPDPFDPTYADVRVGPPLLAQLDGAGAYTGLLLPRPADAAYIGGEVVPLRPVKPGADSHVDLPEKLLPLALEKTVREKPDPSPAWWTAGEYEKWLAAPSVKEKNDLPRSMQALPVDARTHVVIGPNGANVAGGLFRNAGVDFGGSPMAGKRYAPIVETDGAAALDNRHRRVGGEGRPVRIGSASPPGFPCTQPAGLERAKHVRLVLISPAIFETGGWLPDGFDPATLTGDIEEVSLRICSVALERTISFSGWTATGPGRAWRVVPAGTVYWCEVKQGDPGKLWNRSLCQPGWANSGWGHVLVGIVPLQHFV